MSVGRGWAPIEADLRAELAAIGVTDVSTHQKCGWLKVEASPWSPEVQEICDRAEARSRNVCEDCGASPAERHRLPTGWIKTLCANCRAVIRVMVAETDPDAPERIVLSAPRMLDLHPRMRALLAGGWEMTRMEKPVAEGFGIDVVVWFERPKQGEGS